MIHKTKRFKKKSLRLSSACLALFASSLSLFQLSLLPVSQVVTTSLISESVAPGCSLLTASAQIHTQTTLKIENPAVQILENLQVWRKK